MSKAIIAEEKSATNDEHCHQVSSVFLEGERVTRLVVDDRLGVRGTLFSDFIEAFDAKCNEYTKLSKTRDT